MRTMPSQRYERGSTLVTSNLPFDEWTGVFGSERLTGALLDRLTHHVHILEMNGDSYRLKQSKQRQRQTQNPAGGQPATVLTTGKVRCSPCSRCCAWLRSSHPLRCAPWPGRCQVGTGKQAL